MSFCQAIPTTHLNRHYCRSWNSLRLHTNLRAIPEASPDFKLRSTIKPESGRVWAAELRPRQQPFFLRLEPTPSYHSVPVPGRIHHGILCYSDIDMSSTILLRRLPASIPSASSTRIVASCNTSLNRLQPSSHVYTNSSHVTPTPRAKLTKAYTSEYLSTDTYPTILANNSHIFLAFPPILEQQHSHPK